MEIVSTVHEISSDGIYPRYFKPFPFQPTLNTMIARAKFLDESEMLNGNTEHARNNFPQLMMLLGSSQATETHAAGYQALGDPGIEDPIMINRIQLGESLFRTRGLEDDLVTVPAVYDLAVVFNLARRLDQSLQTKLSTVMNNDVLKDMEEKVWTCRCIGKVHKDQFMPSDKNGILFLLGYYERLKPLFEKKALQMFGDAASAERGLYYLDAVLEMFSNLSQVGNLTKEYFSDFRRPFFQALPIDLDEAKYLLMRAIRLNPEYFKQIYRSLGDGYSLKNGETVNRDDFHFPPDPESERNRREARAMTYIAQAIGYLQDNPGLTVFPTRLIMSTLDVKEITAEAIGLKLQRMGILLGPKSSNRGRIIRQKSLI